MLNIGDDKFIGSLIQLRDGLIYEKSNFQVQYQTLSKYFKQVDQDLAQGQNIVSALIKTQGRFLNDGSINDNSGMDAAQKFSAVELGMVWKNERGTFRINPSRFIKDPTQEEKQYFSFVNEQLLTDMENPKAKLIQSLASAVLDKNIYGTSGVITNKGDYRLPLKYQSKSVLQFSLGYSKDGDIDTLCIDYYYTARELYLAYGDRAGSQVKQEIDNNRINTQFVVSLLIHPRVSPKAKRGKLALPYASYLFMPNEQIFLEEGGFESLPMEVMFCIKLDYEAYGRSYAMNALPTVEQANVASEILAVGGEGTALPPLAMWDNGSFGGRAVNLSSGEVTVFDYDGDKPAGTPIFPIYTVGDLRVIMEWLQKCHEDIKKYFYLDVIYEIGEGQRMTLGEYNGRESVKADTFVTTYVNMLKFLTGIIERSMDIEYGMGLLGVADPFNLEDQVVRDLIMNGYTPQKVPARILDLMVRGLDWYDIEFICPVARLMRKSEADASVQFLSILGNASQFDPAFMDAVNPLETIKKLRELHSADQIMLRTPEEMQIIGERRAEGQMQMAQVQAGEIQARTNQMNSQAAASRAGAAKILSEGGTASAVGI